VSNKRCSTPSKPRELFDARKKPQHGLRRFDLIKSAFKKLPKMPNLKPAALNLLSVPIPVAFQDAGIETDGFFGWLVRKPQQCHDIARVEQWFQAIRVKLRNKKHSNLLKYIDNYPNFIGWHFT
jgi:hypothetical protein